MELYIKIGILLVSILGLYFGASFLIKGSVNIANYFNISKMVIALTLVAAGTSMPEFFVTLIGSAKGEASVAIGNIVGSNVTNITLVLSIAALILPFSIRKRTSKLDFPIVIFTTALFYFFLFNGQLSRIEGIILFIFFISYNFFFSFYFKEKPDENLEDIKIDDGKVHDKKYLLINYNQNLLLLKAKIHQAIAKRV